MEFVRYEHIEGPGMLRSAELGSDDLRGPSSTSVPPTAAKSVDHSAVGLARGGALTYLTFSDVRGFDPVMLFAATHTSGNAQAMAVFDALLYEDDDSGELVMRIAESFTSTDNGLTWELKLKPSVKFSDGTPYDAAAVKFNWDRIAAPYSGAATAQALVGIASLDVVDPLTLRITLDEPSVRFAHQIARNVPYIASPRSIHDKGENFSSSPVGAGPFVVSEWVRDSHLVLTRNPIYWNAPLPFVDKLFVQIIPDDAERYNLLRAGGAQMADSGFNFIYAKRAEKAGFSILEDRTIGGLSLGFNFARPPFDDIRMRRAVALAVDLQAHNDSLSQGAGEVPRTLLTESSTFYDDSLVLPGNEPDLAEAQRLVNEYVAEEGGPLAFTMLAADVTAVSFRFFQAQINRLEGVNADIDVVPAAEIPARARAGDWDIGTFNITALPDLVTRYKTGEPLNTRGYSNPRMDDALNVITRSLDQAELKAAAETVQQLIIGDVTDIYYQRILRGTIFERAVHGVVYPNVGPLWDQIWLAESG